MMARAYWDRLESDAQILDLDIPYRPPALFGRTAGKAYSTIYDPLPEFEKLIANPLADKIAEYGYSYVYLDRKTWQEFNREQRESFQRPCVKLIAEQNTPTGDFRRLLDIRNCAVQSGNATPLDGSSGQSTP